MNCATYRTQLEQCFDEGQGLPPPLEEHVRSCASCQAYHAQLAALDAALTEIPLEKPRPALTGEIRARIEQAEGSRRRVPVWGWAAGACVVAAMLVGGWFLPSPGASLWQHAEAWRFDLDLAATGESLWRHAVAWRFDFDLGATGRWFVSSMTTVYRQVAAWDMRSLEFSLPGSLRLPPVLAWSSLAGVLTVLLAFNGIQARTLRTGISTESGAPLPSAAPRTKGDDSC